MSFRTVSRLRAVVEGIAVAARWTTGPPGGASAPPGATARGTRAGRRYCPTSPARSTFVNSTVPSCSRSRTVMSPEWPSMSTCPKNW